LANFLSFFLQVTLMLDLLRDSDDLRPDAIRKGPRFIFVG